MITYRQDGMRPRADAEKCMRFAGGAAVTNWDDKIQWGNREGLKLLKHGGVDE